jgi:hypothetical protein
MKMNIHIRFALYVFAVTVGVASLGMSWYSPFPFILFVWWIPSLKPLVSEESGDSMNSQRDLTGAGLVWRFLGCLVVFWIGALYFAFHFNPSHPPMGLVWTGLGLMWSVFIFRGYRWWKCQKRIADARNSV